MYKTGLSRRYRQLHIDPFDWPFLGFRFDGKYYGDDCPPFGLRSAAMMMQHISRAVSCIHKLRGFDYFAYIDDYSVDEIRILRATDALGSLQRIMCE